MDTPEVLCTLRSEIVESQKTQAEFLKWKLIAISAVGSISLGFTPMTDPPRDAESIKLLLCAVPLICAYVDFVSLHIMIRIVTIGVYLRRHGSEYENFVFLTREKGANPYIFETAALHGSSIVFNLVLIGISFSTIATAWAKPAYLWGGILGIFVTLIAWILYTSRARRVAQIALECA